MKKIIALILVAVMCLAITSCGASKKEELYDKYEKVIDALEDKDYEEVMIQIQKIYEKDQEEDDDKWGGFGGETEEEADPAVEAMKALVPGEWLPSTYVTEDEGFTAFTLNEDGTTTIDGKDLTWKIDYASEGSVDIDILDGDTPVYNAYLYKNDDGTSYISFAKYKDENNTSHIGSFYKASEYTKIELTVDNLLDYFEVFERSQINKDAFGEATDISVYQYLVLKDEYGKVMSDLSNVAIEYSYKEIEVKVSADITTGEYHLGEVIDDRAEYDPYTSTTTMYNQSWDDGEVVRYGMQVGSFYIDEFPVDEVWGVDTEFTPIRVAGTIYTYTPAE